MKGLKKSTINQLLWLFLIVALGFFLRTYHLDSNPAGFFCDEAAIGYNAYSLLKTGKDEFGKSFPFFFRSFGDYRNPVPIYANIPSIAIFGLNEFSVRFTAALAGTLTIIFVFLLTKVLFNSETATFSAFLLAISPWHIHFSRFGSEYIFFPFLLTLAFYLFILGLKKKNYLLLSFFAFGVAFYTYYPAWLVIPLFLTGISIFYLPLLLKIKKSFFAGIIIFLITLIPFVWGIKKEVVLTRWQQVSVFKASQREKMNLPETTQKMANTYLAHFSYDFLFKKGDIDYPGHFINRFSTKGTGELYRFQLPLILAGGLFLFINWKKKSSWIILLWLSLYPLGSTLIGTDGGGPFAFRSIIGVVPFQILSALGLYYFLLATQKLAQPLRQALKIFFLITFLFVALFSLKTYFRHYHYQYPLYSSDFWGWQFGPRDVMRHFLKAKNQYHDLFLMGSFNSPEIFIKFYDPTNSCQNRCQIGGLEKLDFKKKQLYAIGIDRSQEIPNHFTFKIRKTIYYPNQAPAFLIGEIKLK